MPTEPKPAADRGRIWLALLVLYLVWGSTYLGIAIAVETIPSFLMAAVRFGIAGAVLMSWSVVRARGSFVAPSRREWRDSIVVGTLLLGGGMGMVAFGEQTIPSGITALLVAMMPVWVAIFGRALLGERLPRLAGVGIVVGFVGVAILVGPTILGQTGALDPTGVVALIISPIAWSLGSLYASHRATLPRQPLVATGAQMLAGGVVLAVMSGVAGAGLGALDDLTTGARMRPRAVTISATAAMITAPATRVRGSIGSWRTNAPRITATTGLT